MGDLQRLVAFLTARLDETEAWASSRLEGLPSQYVGDLTPEQALAMHTLATVRAHRAILGDQTSDHAPVESIYGTVCRTCVAWLDDEGTTEFGIAIPEQWPCRVARSAAAVYSDHPDYAAVVSDDSAST